MTNHTDLVARLCLNVPCFDMEGNKRKTPCGYDGGLCPECRNKQEAADLIKASGLTLGVGDGGGQLFVHGDYDSIKAAQAYITRVGEQAAEIERLKVERLKVEHKQAAEIERLKVEHKSELATCGKEFYALIHQCSETIKRAEAAEAEVARLREALKAGNE